MSSPGPERPLVLSLRGVSKAFGAVQALRDVSVDCRAGEIHALVGENGSGKSTLLGIASGFVHPDEGVVEIGGIDRRRGSPAEARRLGLGIAYQTYSHVLDLSVAENLYLAVPADVQPTYGRMEEWAAARLEEFELDVPLTAAAGSLSLAERQLLEVVKALLARPKVLLLDEPTTALGPERHRAAPRARVRAEPCRRRHRLRQPSAARGARHRRPHHRPSRRRLPGDVRGRRDVGGEPRRADDRAAAPARLSGAARPGGAARGAACRLGPSRRAIRADRPRGREGRDPRASPAPRATGRCSSSVRSPVSSAPPAVPSATAASSTGRRRSARSGPGSCC